MLLLMENACNHAALHVSAAAGDKRKVQEASVCGKQDFKYQPRLGDAVLFYSLNLDQSVDPHALHGGCPVQKGTKWVLTKWLHNKPVQTGGFGWA